MAVIKTTIFACVITGIIMAAGAALWEIYLNFTFRPAAIAVIGIVLATSGTFAAIAIDIWRSVSK